MSARFVSLVLSFALLALPAQAAPFDRAGYIVPQAIEFLVTRDAALVDLADPGEKEVLAMYAIAFAARLSTQWPDQFSRDFQQRAQTKWTAILLATNRPIIHKTSLAGTSDANVFAKRVDRHSAEARSAMAALIALVGA